MTYNERWYDPRIMQFNQPDTLVPDPGNPADYNRYSYVRYNPVRYTDPSGHICYDEVLDAAWNCGGSGYATFGAGPTIVPVGKGYAIVQPTIEPFETFEEIYGVSFEGNWNSDDRFEAKQGVRAVDRALAGTRPGYEAGEAFQETYDPLTFLWVEATCEIGGSTCYADAYLAAQGIIRFWASYHANDGNIYSSPITPELAVHELGHVFDYLAGRVPSHATFGAGIDDRSGFGLRISGDLLYTEVFADFFLNYVYDSFTNNAAGRFNNNFGQEHFNKWAALAVSRNR